MNTCCKDCAERHPKCHGSCKKYLEASEKRKKANAKRLEEQGIDSVLFKNAKKVKSKWIKDHK